MFLGRIRESWEGIDASQRKFVLRVLGAIVIWLIVDGFVGLDEYLTGFVANVAVGMVKWFFGDAVVLESKMVWRDQFWMNQLRMVGSHATVGVGHSCNGKEILFLFSAFIFALPGYNWKRKLGYVFMGISTLALANAFRLAMLYIIMRDAPAWFEISHKNIFQMLMYVIMVVIWLMFLKRK